jgi:hypothetical protein
MRVSLAAMFLAGIAAFLLVAKSAEAQVTNPVVLELFTSEGCSSCPPADALLLKLEQPGAIAGAEIIALGEHVDYWNDLGWNDRFSSHVLTRRQGQYAARFSLNSVYTPQLVIDGRVELVGSDSAQVVRKIAQAASKPKPAKITLLWKPDPLTPSSLRKGGAADIDNAESAEMQPKALAIDVRQAGSAHARVLLALTESGLSTSVAGGENGGRVLHHPAVVRVLRDLGQIRDGSFSANLQVPIDPQWKPENLRVVVLVQQLDNAEILGAAALNYR